MCLSLLDLDYIVLVNVHMINKIAKMVFIRKRYILTSVFRKRNSKNFGFSSRLG